MTVSHTGTVLYAGTNVSLTCNVSLDAAVDTDISVNIKWYKGEMQLMSIVATTPPFVGSHTLTPLTDKDQGRFTCKAQTHSDDTFVVGGSENEMSISINVSQRG